jgi:hypothetical protein
MAPREIVPSGVLSETEAETIDGALIKPAPQVAEDRKFVIVWRNVVVMSALHMLALAGLWMLMTGRTKWQTNVCGKFGQGTGSFVTCLFMRPCGTKKSFSDVCLEAQVRS